jgi:hypothetical protein
MNLYRLISLPPKIYLGKKFPMPGQRSIRKNFLTGKKAFKAGFPGFFDN